MSDIIRLLPDSVANQIAAGEVIQRPASVIKELIENAVDAGATDIKVIIKDAGKTLIQVIDNGSGMSETDVRLAFERHATSKIRNAEDLFSLHTMGFRGEALPSICAISEVEVKTRTADDQMGTRLLIQGSKVLEQEPCICEKGTSIAVRKIFYNVPARRKFLKSDNVELSNIMREFERLALVNNNIRLFIDNGIKQMDLRAASLRIRIEDIWKNTLKSEYLIPVEVDTSLVKIEGFISRPEFARRRNPLQYLIVNGRNMRHPYFHKAIVGCYESLIASDTMPCYFIKFTVDPASIDVNIHPTKNEIKFEYEQQIWPILVSAVKTALGKFAAVPSIDFTIDAIPMSPLKQGETAHVPTMDYKSDYNPFEQQLGGGGGYTPGGDQKKFRVDGMDRFQRVDSNWQKLYEGFSKELPAKQEQKAGRPVASRVIEESQPTQICLQVAAKYIITTLRDSLVVIDQHRAHVKILYEEYLSRAKRAEIVSQSVMFPETVTLDSSQQAALDGVGEELRRLGFALEYDCDNCWKIVATPPLPAHTDAKDVVLRILDSIADDSANYGNEADIAGSLNSRVALLMARSAAIRRGQVLTGAEMERIVSDLFALPDPSLTPNGNPIFTILDDPRLSQLLS